MKPIILFVFKCYDRLQVAIRRGPVHPLRNLNRCIKTKNTKSLMLASSKQRDAQLLLRARRMATRSRAAVACLPCKFKKAKCGLARPCARCVASNEEQCADVHSKNSKQSTLLQNMNTSFEFHNIVSPVSAYGMVTGGLPDRTSFNELVWSAAVTTSQVSAR